MGTSKINEEILEEKLQEDFSLFQEIESNEIYQRMRLKEIQRTIHLKELNKINVGQKLSTANFSMIVDSILFHTKGHNFGITYKGRLLTKKGLLRKDRKTKSLFVEFLQLRVFNEQNKYYNRYKH